MIEREVVEEKTGSTKGKLLPTPAGELIADFLGNHFEQVVDYGFTAEVEEHFDDIAENKLERNKMLQEFYDPFHALIQKSGEIDVQFRSEEDFEDFQRFVRGHQQRVLFNPSPINTVWLNWPERNIDNWTGVIKAFKAGGERFVFAPRASFIVSLIDSMVSSRTDIASLVPNWRTIYGEGMGPGAVLAPPTQDEKNQAKVNNWGSYDTPREVNGWGTPNGGITAGSG
jgi:hypothetical protein